MRARARVRTTQCTRTHHGKRARTRATHTHMCTRTCPRSGARHPAACAGRPPQSWHPWQSTRWRGCWRQLGPRHRLPRPSGAAQWRARVAVAAMAAAVAFWCVLRACAFHPARALLPAAHCPQPKHFWSTPSFKLSSHRARPPRHNHTFSANVQPPRSATTTLPATAPARLPHAWGGLAPTTGSGPGRAHVREYQDQGVGPRLDSVLELRCPVHQPTPTPALTSAPQAGKAAPKARLHHQCRAREGLRGRHRHISVARWATAQRAERTHKCAHGAHARALVHCTCGTQPRGGHAPRPSTLPRACPPPAAARKWARPSRGCPRTAWRPPRSRSWPLMEM